MFSTMMVWPSASCSFAASTRIGGSDEPPAGNGTMILIGLLGQASWAKPTLALPSASTQARTD
jgi:hypothetical protein